MTRLVVLTCYCCVRYCRLVPCCRYAILRCDADSLGHLFAKQVFRLRGHWYVNDNLIRSILLALLIPFVAYQCSLSLSRIVVLLGMSVASCLTLAAYFHLSANMFLDALGNGDFLNAMTTYGNYANLIYYKVCITYAIVSLSLFVF